MVQLMVAIATVAMLCVLVGCTPIGPGLSVKKSSSEVTQSQGKKKPLPKAESMQIPIGKIHFVDREAGFVLIKSSRTRQLEPGTPIVAYGSGAVISARMKASPATKSGFLAADLTEGVPRVGDMVTIVHTVSRGSSETVPGAAANQLNSQIQVLE